MLEFEEHKLYTHKININENLKAETFATLDNYLRSKGMNDDADCLEGLFEWKSPGSWEDYATEKGTTWAKRFAVACYKKYQIRISSQALAIIGDYTKQASVERTLYFEFAKFSNWKQGAFAEREGKSCWWDSYNHSRLGIVQAPQGHAILFYDSPEHYEESSRTQGAGRCWLWVEPEFALIFNSYGLPLSTVANALSEMWGVPTYRTKMHSPHAAINSGNFNNLDSGGNVQDSKDTGLCWAITNIGKLDLFTIEDFSYKDGECGVCKTPVVKSRSHTIIINDRQHPICESCNNTVKKCNLCERLITGETEEVHREGYGNMEVCPHCAANSYHCEFHGKTLGHSKMQVWHTNRLYCSDCYPEKVCMCDNCSRYSDNYTYIIRRKVCATCAKTIIKELTYYGHHAD